MYRENSVKGNAKGSIEGLSMEINLEICNRSIKCSSGESFLLIHRKESLNNFYFTKEQKPDKRDNFVFTASVLVPLILKEQGSYQEMFKLLGVE